MKSLKVILVLAILIASFGNLSANTGWNKVYIPIKANIGNLEFLNANFGVVTTEKNDILVTYNGGNTFVNKTNCLFDTSHYITQIKIKCENEIYLIHNNNLYLSTDQCCTWKKTQIDKCNDSMRVWSFEIFDNNYYCMTSEGLYSYNNLNWLKIMTSKDLIDGSDGYSFPKFLSNNFFIVSCTIKNESCGGGHTYFSYNNFYSISSNNQVVLVNSTNISDYVNYYDFMINIDNKLYATIQDDFMISSDYGKTWENYFKKSDNNLKFSFMSNISNCKNKFYLTNNTFDDKIKKIYKVIEEEVLECKLDTSGNYNINNIISIDDETAFASLNTYYRYYNLPVDITNYFLKTSDGGGVSATSVESDEVKSSIKESNELHLIDMLGKEIRSYDNYYKFEMDKPNLAPPFLIKWKDNKGVYHFQKL